MADGLHWLGPELDSLPRLLTLAHATLASSGERRDTTWAFTRAALENLVAAALVEVNEPLSDSIVDRSLEDIRRSSSDPSFDVAALAATQLTTPRWLQGRVSKFDNTQLLIQEKSSDTAPWVDYAATEDGTVDVAFQFSTPDRNGSQNGSDDIYITLPTITRSWPWERTDLRLGVVPEWTP
ncbi:hypothetical protein C5E02_12700 [Rathayibacter rathayi]|uniref:hypothetical protein n=1 Tax=Rathayibacter rathayi TaxID=33887 RepID=UPI000CE74A82|nr:hypothetical protein [Rathayibacter rathayi]PPG07867.1 hypothetical protein C5C11_15970 [Rathayibacter rathayi]PPG35760.1 hypothetical protein C5C20_15865 [Rathayibacter rathayi]PPG93151.1 hypothetical protein C5C22_11635 [Rathayibacter rathayi]PPI58975.1 hypothetical protein C5E02_12700 [Rathayibacter rathayi]